LIKKKECSLPITHSFYLKEFQSKFDKFRVKDEYDVVLLDEAQDTNLVTLSVFERFNAKKIMVGDSHQKIYGFRGAIDAMERFKADITLRLTYTFRFDKKEQVELANNVLYYLKCEDTDNLIKPAGQVRDDELRDLCVITRTNAKLIELMAQNDDFKPVRHPKNFFEPIFKIFECKIPVPEQYNNFIKYLEILETIAEKTEDTELKSCISLIQKYNCRKEIFLMLYDKAIRNRRRKLNTYISTAHTAKGLEFDIVLLADDFSTVEDLVEDIVLHKPAWLSYFTRDNMLYVKKGNLRNFFKYLIEDNSIQMNTIKEEINLFYVAITRAKKVLRLDDCYFVDPNMDIFIDLND
jgi:superfamily I DNA/RNA helicase